MSIFPETESRERHPSERQARSCEEATTRHCRCRCGGALHGARRAGLASGTPRDFFEQLPDGDPHRLPRLRLTDPAGPFVILLSPRDLGGRIKVASVDGRATTAFGCAARFRCFEDAAAWLATRLSRSRALRRYSATIDALDGPSPSTPWAGTPTREPYRPSNGTEGECFVAEFCSRCTRDSPKRPCLVLTRAFAHDVGDPLYPPQWVLTDRGEPICTAFRPKE